MKQEEYLCIPTRRGKGTVVLCLGLLIFSVLSFYLARRFPQGRVAGQFLSVVLLLFFVQLSNKFLLTEYRYYWKDGLLSLSKKQGNTVKSLGSIQINSDFYLMKKDEWKREKKGFTVSRSFSCCQNMASPDTYILLCPDQGSFFLLSFEPDETLVRAIREKIGEGEEG